MRFRGINQIEYKEGPKKLILDGERLAPGAKVSLWYLLEKDHEWVDPSGEKVSLEEKQKIKKNIEEEMLKNHVKADVEIA